MAASRTVTATFVPTQAAITSPANGSTLSGSTVTFNWTGRGTGAISYQLWVGSTVGGHDIAVGITTGLSTTISGLPDRRPHALREAVQLQRQYLVVQLGHLHRSVRPTKLRSPVRPKWIRR